MRPDPDQARSWLESELSKAEYHQQSLLERLQAWLMELWAHLTAAASGASGLSMAAAVTLALVVIALACVVVPRIRRTPAVRRDHKAVLHPQQVSADEHRSRAEAALAAGDYAEAVVEAMRALARRMVDRGVLEETPGSTAHEIAVAVAEAFPAEKPRLLTAAGLFDAVQYGGESATAEQASSILALHDDLRRARSSSVVTPAPETLAVPR